MHFNLHVIGLTCRLMHLNLEGIPGSGWGEKDGSQFSLISFPGTLLGDTPSNTPFPTMTYRSVFDVPQPPKPEPKPEPKPHPLTQTELWLLEDSTTEQEWDAACDAIKAARRYPGTTVGRYPPDWYEKVIASGLRAVRLSLHRIK
jgi:hypothetical protein